MYINKENIFCRYGEIGKHKGLKIPRRKLLVGSSPTTGTIGSRDINSLPSTMPSFAKEGTVMGRKTINGLTYSKPSPGKVGDS